MKTEIRVTMRKPEVKKALGVSDTTLDDLVALGLLDPPFKLTPGGRAVGWDAETIAKYQAERRKETVVYKTDAPRLAAMQARAKQPKATPPAKAATAKQPTAKLTAKQRLAAATNKESA